MKNIAFIGAGRLATNLAVALQGAGVSVVQVYSRTEESARTLGERLHCPYTSDIDAIDSEADCYVYALTDTVLPLFAGYSIGGEGAIHIHTAGSIPMDVFRGKQRYGVLYPFQSFSKEKLVDFAHIPILIEGSDSSVEDEIEWLARKVSDRIFHADLEHRQRLHLAGVFANNFTNCLYALAEEQLKKAGLPFDILLPLIEETAQRVRTIAPRKAQTGPAVRQDNNVMNRQLQLLSDEQDLQMLYRLLSDNIIGYRE